MGGDGELVAVDVLALAEHDAVQGQQATPPEQVQQPLHGVRIAGHIGGERERGCWGGGGHHVERQQGRFHAPIIGGFGLIGNRAYLLNKY